MSPLADFIHQSPFYEVAALLALAAVVGFIGQLLRQPMIVSFLVVGVVAGPSVTGIVRSHEQIEVLAELGVALLLFLVGLKLDPKLIRSLGGVALATGLGQVLFTSVIGFGIGLLLGLDVVTSVYVAVALTFSSTIIIVKMLSDKREVDSLHGRIAVGFLIVQDLVVILAMLALSSFGLGAPAGGEQPVLLRIAIAIAYAAAMLLLLFLFVRYVANRLVSRMLRSSELLVIIAIAWAALLASLGGYFGFGLELGGLLAGISFAAAPSRETIVSRLSPLRDFLLLFFFIALGSQLDLRLLGAQVVPALIFSVFVLVGNPLIVMIIMGALGYRRRTGFLAGLTVAQISEFSLIFVAMGVSLGHTPPASLGLVTLVGMITIALSVYMITYSHQLYRWLEPMLDLFERRSPSRETSADLEQIETGRWDAILIGLGRYGSAIAEGLLRHNLRLLAVDFDPEVVSHWRARGFEALYGDVSDPDFITTLPLQQVSMIVAALPPRAPGLAHEDPRLILIDSLRQHHYHGRIAVAAHPAEHIESLKARGVNIVLLPFRDAANEAVDRLMNDRHDPPAPAHGSQPSAHGS